MTLNEMKKGGTNENDQKRKSLSNETQALWQVTMEEKNKKKRSDSSRIMRENEKLRH